MPDEKKDLWKRMYVLNILSHGILDVHILRRTKIIKSFQSAWYQDIQKPDVN